MLFKKLIHIHQDKNKNKLFYKSLLERTLKIEEEIHKFYGKKYESNKGIVNWIKKTQK